MFYLVYFGSQFSALIFKSLSFSSACCAFSLHALALSNEACSGCLFREARFEVQRPQGEQFHEDSGAECEMQHAELEQGNNGNVFNT